MKIKTEQMDAIISEFWDELEGNSIAQFKDFVIFNYELNKFVPNPVFKTPLIDLNQVAMIVSTTFAGFCLGVASEMKKQENAK